jgi:hypothetical protein
MTMHEALPNDAGGITSQRGQGNTMVEAFQHGVGSAEHF